MRTLLALASLTLLVGAGVGCGDDTTTTTVADMTAVADLSVAHDMMTLNCGQIISCTIACSGSCAQTCLAEGKQASAQAAAAFFTCALGACSPDGGQDPICLGTTVNDGLNGAGPCATQGTACKNDP
jgi:hypothetical protein